MGSNWTVPSAAKELREGNGMLSEEQVERSAFAGSKRVPKSCCSRQLAAWLPCQPRTTRGPGPSRGFLSQRRMLGMSTLQRRHQGLRSVSSSELLPPGDVDSSSSIGSFQQGPCREWMFNLISQTSFCQNYLSFRRWLAGNH